MALEDLSKYIGRAEEQLRPALERRIERLSKKEREEQLYGAEKLQQAGRFTSGFRTDWMERVMDIYEGYRTEARGEMSEKALSSAQWLYGLAEQAERAEKQRLFQAEEAEKGRLFQAEQSTLQRQLEQARLDAEVRMKALDRELTQQGWSVQAKQAEMDRQLTKEGWDWQSKESILDRSLTREELTQRGALTREGYAMQERIARLAREGIGGGVSAPTYTAPTTTDIAPKTTTTTTTKTKASTTPKAYSKAISTYYASLGQAQAYKPAITSAAKTAFGRRSGGVFY